MQRPPQYIPPGTRIDATHSHAKFYANQSADELRARWQTPEGQAILDKWRAANFDRNVLGMLVGSFYDKLDARGAPIRSSRLAGVNLSHIDFFAADCRSVDFTGSNLEGSFLSEADIRGADFSWAKMAEAFLDGAKFDDNTRFLGVNLNAVNFNLAALLRERAITQQRVADLERRYPALAFFLRITCDYGRSLMRWSVWVIGAILAFAFAYWAIPGATSAANVGEAVYFSVVTFTTLGYGDVLPLSALGKVLALVEVVIGYLMGGLLVAILTRKVLGS